MSKHAAPAPQRRSNHRQFYAVKAVAESFHKLKAACPADDAEMAKDINELYDNFKRFVDFKLSDLSHLVAAPE
jgi:hypothetical protein